MAEWPESEKAPIKYSLCDLPAEYSLRRIVRLVKCRWKIEQDYHQLREELGLDHYEGRNWQGWHHHVTMVMIAHAFLTLETLRSKKAALSENLTERPLLRNFLHPLNRKELDVGQRHPLGLQQQIAQVLVAPPAVNQHTNIPVHGFHYSEANLGPAVVHNTFDVLQ